MLCHAISCKYSCVQFWGVSVNIVYITWAVDYVLDWLWTVYWSDYGLCIGLIMDCLLDWLQQTGKGAVNNVAHKITKVLKYKIRLPQIILYNLI